MHRAGPTGLAETWLIDLASDLTPIPTDGDPIRQGRRRPRAEWHWVNFLGTDLFVFEPWASVWELRPHGNGPTNPLGIPMAYNADSERLGRSLGARDSLTLTACALSSAA